MVLLEAFLFEIEFTWNLFEMSNFYSFKVHSFKLNHLWNVVYYHKHQKLCEININYSNTHGLL